METILKITILLLLSLTQAIKTNSYSASVCEKVQSPAVPVEVTAKCETKEMESFWLTQILMMEN